MNYVLNWKFEKKRNLLIINNWQHEISMIRWFENAISNESQHCQSNQFSGMYFCFSLSLSCAINVVFKIIYFRSKWDSPKFHSIFPMKYGIDEIQIYRISTPINMANNPSIQYLSLLTCACLSVCAYTFVMRLRFAFAEYKSSWNRIFIRIIWHIIILCRALYRLELWWT